jgi:hypothetical protein
MQPSNPSNRDEFQKTGKLFQLPENIESLDPLTRRQVAICSLFAHQEIPVRHISKVMGIEYGQVVKTLLEEGLVKERRKGTQREQDVRREA